MKRLIKTIDLRFFQDDANGEWGLAHADTLESNGSSFNAFWNGIGIFHDVFEHSHEHQNKYFRGDYAMNVGGEMAAMGAMWYYIDVLGVGNRIRNGYFSPSDVMRSSTQDMVHEAIEYGGANFGSTLESNVPKQRPTDNSELEYQIQKFWKETKQFDPEKSNYEQEIERGNIYKNSVSFRKIADLHRYGFRMAEKLVPNNWDNAKILYNFIDVWNTFTAKNNAESMANYFNGVTIKLYKENGRISWTALFKGNSYDVKDQKITADNIEYFNIEDLFFENL